MININPLTQEISMAEGDFGLAFTITFNGDCSSFSRAEFIIKQTVDDTEPLVVVPLVPDESGIASVSLTEEQSGLLSYGMYRYGIKIYGTDSRVSLIHQNVFRVVKAV